MLAISSGRSLGKENPGRSTGIMFLPFLMYSSMSAAENTSSDAEVVSYVITKERLYCNLLLVDTMSPYVEMGYGIGTNIFNMGVFWGGEVDKWDRIGVKFTFEIFN